MTSILPVLQQGGADALDQLLEETVAKRDTPAIFFLATNAKETIYANQKGEVVFGQEQSGQITSDTVTEIFSQTKLITCLAALQLVDQKLVNLDSESDVEKYLPEVGKLQLITGYDEAGEVQLSDPIRKVTLRMLMSHTAGFVYSTVDSLLSRYNKDHPDDLNIFDSTASVTTISRPLVYEPGTSWYYSTSIDWVGKLVERASGQRLDEYFQKHIFDPLGCDTLTFFPTEEIKSRKMAVCYRGPDGKVLPIPGGFGMNRPSRPEDVSTDLLLGGAGLFGTQNDYLKILRALLQCDPSYSSSNPLISPASYKELFTGCVQEYGRKRIVEMVSRPNYINPPPTSDTIDHSVGFLLTLLDFEGGRKAGSGSWSGAAKSQFWIDPTTGIAAICATQLLGPSPDPWFAVYTEYERALYNQLRKE